ncbi:hypothetical protein [Mycolicibacterium gadium]|jgi:hypothetical protein|uniref:Gfo/Idh/MocA family oxidoreductase n=1 Tax=Mycolicibacterium gadium TaxID=1794 RepID=A0ABT6GM12_MYCGU|nr:hypothetical protein [Mycolicibacterium gadium]MDG5482423.1 hypothetical protein [Mycolicibacterium gadium]
MRVAIVGGGILGTAHEQFLGRPLPPIRQRWAEVYSQCVDPAQSVDLIGL